MSEKVRGVSGATKLETSSAFVVPIGIQSIVNSVPNLISVVSAPPLRRIIAAESSPEEKSFTLESATNLQGKSIFEHVH